MSQFLERDKRALIEYEIRDSIITLKHATAREELNMTQKNKLGLLQLYQLLVQKYVVNEWDQILNKHFPYPISAEYWIENAD
jgi:hypothetical protein